MLQKADFVRVFREGTRSSMDGFTFHTAPNGLTYARLGVTVSRQVSARAIARNRIKRLVRESFRQRRQSLGGHDVVVVAGALSAKRDNPSNRAALESAWDRIALKHTH